MRYQLHQGGGSRGGNAAINTHDAEWVKKLAFDSTWTWSPVVPEPVEACIHSLVKRVACEKPDAPAICSWDGDLTYLQLDQLSSRLAYQLVDAGVTPGSKVLLCFEKTCLAPVSMLAMMKAGGVSIALDIEQDHQHLRAIADQISAPIIISSSENERLARKLGKSKVIIVDHELLSSLRNASKPSHDLPAVSPSDTLCEVYGVDSTIGLPEQGIKFTHRSLSSAATYQQAALGITPSSRICDLESYSSNAAWHNLLVLTCGGSLCIPPTPGYQGNRSDLISALQSNNALLSHRSAAVLDNSELFRLVQLKYMAASVDPLGFKPLGHYITTSNEPRILEDTSPASDDSCVMPMSETEKNGTGSLVGKLDTGETVIGELQIIDEGWQVSSRDLIDDHTMNARDGPFVLDLNKQPTVRCEEIGLSDSSTSPVSSNGSVATYEDVMSRTEPTDHEPSGHTILPFSLLDSSISKGEIRAYAARLCSVKESQVLDIMPCTPLQEGLLALTTKRSGDYVAKNIFEIANGIDTERLRRAWDQVVSMNSILRTRIASFPHHGIMQVVLDDGVPWAFGAALEDSEHIGSSNENNEMGLGTPLVKFAIFETGAGNPRYFRWEIHHALYDGWTIPLLLSQAEQAYFNELCQPLQPMTAFIKYILDRDIGAEKSFWQDQFANIKGSHFPLTKAGYHPKPDSQFVQTVSGLNWGQGDFTPATVIRAAWSVTAANGAGSNESLFGVVVTGRQAPVPNIELMAGPTIATLPIRVNVDWDEKCRKLLDTIQRQSVEMIPFEQTGLQRISRISEQTAAGCQFQTLLVIQPSSEGEQTPSKPFLTESVSSQAGNEWQDFNTYPVVVECQLEPDGVQLRVGFDSTLIRKQKMERVIDGFIFAVKELSNSSLQQERLAILAQDYSGLEDIWAWNERVPEATESCIHNLISQRVQENPYAQAICAWDGEMTYQELDSLSTELAYKMVDKGIAGTVVPLLFEKSKFMPVAVLAVMKAGGGCLPVDIKQPYERLSAITAQANSSIIVSSVANEAVAVKLAAAKKAEDVEVVVVGPDQLSAVSAATRTLPNVKPSDILYVVFTSGSTGTPKGVINTHRGLCSAISYQQKALGFSSTSRVFDFASYAFDAAWCNLLHALTVGGTLCIPSQDERENDLAGCLEKYNVTTVDFTPSVARFLGPAVLSRLSTLILGGEAVLPGDVHLAGDNTDIINVYGPAECTPTATFADITKASSINIGRGAGVCTWVVDPDDPESLAPVGTVGELWLEGPLVGEGYLNDPEKTAAAFVQDPAWLLRGLPARPGLPGRPGRSGQLYRTGDLVQYKEDGSLIFVSRKDTQVKIRGQRVELGDVEQHVLDNLTLNFQVHDVNVSNAQVTAETIHPEGSNSAVLVVFVTLTCEGDVEVTEDTHASAVKKATDGLSDRLAEKVPIYMIPTSYIPMWSLPMTPTGKTDRKKLRATGEYLWLKYRNTADDEESTETLTDVEIILQQVWMSVLNLSACETSVNKPFTRLGGDSITAMQVVSQCRLHNISITVSQILQASTIRRLAANCQVGSSDSTATEDYDALDIEQTEQPFELGPIQQMFFESYPDGLNHYNQTFVLELGKPVLPDTFEAAVRALVKRHAALRTRFRRDSESGRWMQAIFSEDDALSLVYAEHSVSSHHDVAKAGQQRQLSLDIKTGPLFACDLFNVPGYPQVVILSAHHLVVDLVSWRIIWGDLEDFIENGMLVSQPTASFQAWCKRQAKIGQNLSPLSVLPYSMPESGWDFWGLPLSENTFNDLVVFTETFDESLTIQLFGDSNSCLRTEPVDIILGAVAHSFLHTFSERAVPVIWTEGHGRDQLDDFHLDVSGTVGWFTTIQPLPIDITLASSVFDAIKMVKDRRSGVPGKGLPYFACRYYSESGKEAFKDHQAVEVMFNFTGRYQQLEAEEGLFKRPQNMGEADSLIQEVPELARRFTLIEVDSHVEGDRLVVSFSVHKKMKHQDRIGFWARNFGDTLTSVTGQLLHSKREFTLNDLPCLSLSYFGLDVLLKEQLPSMEITPGDIADIYPCSPLQEGILLSVQKEAASYDSFSIWRCISHDGTSVSPSRLEAAWKTVVSRHTILQSVFSLHPEGSGYIQIVLPKSTARVSHIITSDNNPVSVLSALERPTYHASEPEHSFTICSSENGEVACRLDANHTLIDGWSVNVLVQDIIALYMGSNLAPAPPFGSIIRYISTIPKAQRITSWSKLLSGVKPSEFPTIPKQQVQMTKEADQDIPIAADSIPGVLDVCKKLVITRSVFLQVAWAMLLSYFTSKPDVCFGYLSSCRDSPVDGVDTIVGPLANLLISRIDLRPSTKEVLKKVSETSIRHLEIQHTSLADIQHHVGLSGKRLFNTALSIRGGDKLKGGDDATLSFESCTGEDPNEYDLNLSVNVDGDSMDAVVSFRPSYISRQVAQEAANVLIKAINYLVALNTEDTNDTSLCGDFFKSIVGVDEESTQDFWRAHFSNTQGAHFPDTRSVAYKSKPNLEKTIYLQNLEWAGCSKYTATTLIKAAWSIVSARNLRSDEALFGESVSGGAPVLPVRIQLDWDTTIDQLLEVIQGQAEKMGIFSRTPLERIRSINNDTRVGCCFRTVIHMIDHLCKDSTAYNPSPMNATIKEACVDAAAITVKFFIEPDSMKICLRFDSGIIGEVEAMRIGHQFEHVLRQILKPRIRGHKLRDVVVISSQDIKNIWEWNRAVPEPVIGCVHQLIVEQALETPLAPAINAWDGELTYQELNDLSTYLAHTLIDKGVGRGSIVPLLFEKSMWTPVAALAVMKAGGALVLTDPTSQPEERLRTITTLVKAKICLSSAANEALARSLGIEHVLLVGPDHLPGPILATPQQSEDSTLPNVHPTDLLYIMFTSGTTGTPKGVMLSHQNLCSAITYQRAALGYTQTSRVLDFSSYAFDVAWSNLLNTLTVGACLCIASTSERQNDLSGCLEKYRVTLADLTPSIARHLSGLEKLSTLVLGGEVVLPTDVDLAGDKTTVINAYGPAECTTSSTILDLTESPNGGLGRGVGLCTWIVEPDDPGTLAPLHSPGELWLEGPLVGDGYLDDPIKSAAAFIEDPAWLVKGAPGHHGRRGRVYRTGDLVRYKEDGSIVYLGRKDTQVKIRGQRVELGEVEHWVMNAIQAPRESSVNVQVVAETIQPMGAGTSILAAFVSLGTTDETHDAAVKKAVHGVNDRLAISLPPYLIPTTYIPLQTIPRMPTGKIDRSRLRSIGASLSSEDLAQLSRSDSERLPPQTEAERLIQGLWAEVLKVDPDTISADDSFFRIGGDSIGAMRLVGMARQKDFSLTVRDIFRSPVLRDLAALQS
ncbi:NRPS cluster protein [Microsporum canis]